KSVQKTRLSSEKNLARAARELNEALALPERLAEGLRALAAAMVRMQERQQAALEPLATFAGQVQTRMVRLGEHMQAYSELGKAAGEVTARLQAGAADPAETLAEVKKRLDAIADGARGLFEAAHSDDFPEVAREADALRQRVTSLRRRLEAN